MSAARKRTPAEPPRIGRPPKPARDLARTDKGTVRPKIDLSPSVLTRAERYVARHNLHSRARFLGDLIQEALARREESDRAGVDSG